MKTLSLAGALILLALMSQAAPEPGPRPASATTAASSRTSFHWTTGPPVLRAAPADGEDWLSVKDPSVVRHNDAWHLFFILRGGGV